MREVGAKVVDDGVHSVSGIDVFIPCCKDSVWPIVTIQVCFKTAAAGHSGARL